MTRSLPLACLLILVSASPGVAQDARLAARLAPGPRMAVQEMVDSAGPAGVPTEPLIQKALEGASKGADSTRIVAAVRALFANLRTARQTLGPTAREADLVAAAAALRVGGTAEYLGRLSRLRPADQLAVPLSVLADLLVSGMPAGQAWQRVYDMAARGADDAAFLDLRDRLAGPSARPDRGLPPPAEQPPQAPLPGTARPR